MPGFLQWIPLSWYVYSYTDYGSNTSGMTSKNNIKRISKLQKRAARIILHADYNTPSSEMFKELGWSTIKNRHDYNKAVLTFKVLNNMTPDYIAALLTPISETYDHTLRSTNDGTLLVPRSRTSIFDRSFSVSTPKTRLQAI